MVSSLQSHLGSAVRANSVKTGKEIELDLNQSHRNEPSSLVGQAPWLKEDHAVYLLTCPLSLAPVP